MKNKMVITVVLTLVIVLLAGCPPPVAPTPEVIERIVEVPAEVDEAAIVHEAVDAYLKSIPVGVWFLIPPEKLRERLDAGVPTFLLDVRTPKEWDESRIAGAVHVQLTALTDYMDALPADKDAPIVIYCKMGYRGGLALSALRILGYTNVLNLSGGILAWQAAGFPVEQ